MEQACTQTRHDGTGLHSNSTNMIEQANIQIDSMMEQANIQIDSMMEQANIQIDSMMEQANIQTRPT
jgi:hypothetical protein